MVLTKDNQYRLITGPGELVTPADDAAIRDAILPNNGFFFGGTVTRTNNTTITLASGKGHVRGREFAIEKSIAIPVVPSSATSEDFRAAVLYLDYKSATPITIDIVTKTSATALTDFINTFPHPANFNNESAGASKDGFILCTFRTKSNAIQTSNFVPYTQGTSANGKSMVKSVESRVNQVSTDSSAVKAKNETIEAFIKDFLVRQTNSGDNRNGYIRFPWGLSVQWGRITDFVTPGSSKLDPNSKIQQRNGVKFAKYTNVNGKSISIFVANPIVLAQICHDGGGGNTTGLLESNTTVKINGITTESFNAYLHNYHKDSTAANASLYVNWVAIGWWKSLDTSGKQINAISYKEGNVTTAQTTNSRKDCYI